MLHYIIISQALCKPPSLRPFNEQAKVGLVYRAIECDPRHQKTTPGCSFPKAKKNS